MYVRGDRAPGRPRLVGSGPPDKLTYADPRVFELYTRDLTLTDSCRESLIREQRSGKDLSAWYVVQAVLLALVNERECVGTDIGVDTLGGGGGAEATEECSVSSEGQVAIAYKRVALAELLAAPLPMPAPPPVPTLPAPPARTWTSPSTGMVFVRVEPGSFTMGSGEEGRDDDEAAHLVTLTRAYWLGTTEVTQAQYRAVMGSNPSATGRECWFNEGALRGQGRCEAPASAQSHPPHARQARSVAATCSTSRPSRSVCWTKEAGMAGAEHLRLVPGGGSVADVEEPASALLLVARIEQLERQVRSLLGERSESDRAQRYAEVSRLLHDWALDPYDPDVAAARMSVSRGDRSS